MSEIIKSELPSFGRYEVSSDLTVLNRATGNQMKKEQSGDRFFYRLTNDSGERVRVYVAQIEEHFESIKPVEKSEVVILKDEDRETKSMTKEKIETSSQPEGIKVSRKPDLNYRENGKRKMTEDEVRKLRQLAESGTKQSDLTVMFDLHSSTVSNIIKRRLYKTLK